MLIPTIAALVAMLGMQPANTLNYTFQSIKLSGVCYTLMVYCRECCGPNHAEKDQLGLKIMLVETS